MKKAIQYIALLTLLFTHSWQAHAVALPHAAMENGGAHTSTKENIVTDSYSDSDGFFHKGDVLADLDDYDESDFDDHSVSLKEKPLGVESLFTTTTPPVSYIARPFCNTLYTHYNFSRIPRHNFISLRVLRI